jgi:hypothetical protein
MANRQYKNCSKLEKEKNKTEPQKEREKKTKKQKYIHMKKIFV